MLNYKENLIGLIKKAVADLYSGNLVSSEITESGFYCDFDLSEPINPEKTSAINDWLSDRDISCAYEISGFSGVYQDEDAGKKMLQRLYITAFVSQEELQANQEKLIKAAEYEHKRLGAQLGLFSTSEEIGQGLVLWHPKGAIIRFLLIDCKGYLFIKSL